MMYTFDGLQWDKFECTCFDEAWKRQWVAQKYEIPINFVKLLREEQQVV